jgi:hypothetical protein
MSLFKQTRVMDFVVKQAQSVPGLINSLKAVDPEAAQQLITKPLFKSRTPPVTVAVTVITWLSAKYGFGWDANTDYVVAMVVLAVVSYIMRSITTQATAGLVKTPPMVPPNTVPAVDLTAVAKAP